MNQPLPSIHAIDPSYVTRKVFPAGDWALDEPENSRAVVGNRQRILWADGETLFICADTGHGKSTLTQNIVRANIGLIPDILGMAARQFTSILYMAADRPMQIKSSLKRMVDESTRKTWNDSMYVHHGPPDFTLNENPERLLPFIRELAEKLERPQFDCLVIDSMKDVTTQMDENPDGQSINRALQSVCQQGVQVLVDIHPRKMNKPKTKDAPPILDDVAGNKNIIAGAGSVLFIEKTEYGFPLYHLKSPAEAVDGLVMRMNNSTGSISYSYRGLD